MGWLILLLIAAAAMGAALWLRFPRALWTMLGPRWRWAGGLCMAGAADPAASAPAPRPDPLLDNDAISELRGQLIGRYGGEAAMFTAADALSRRQQADGGAGHAGRGRRRSGQRAYWTELGNVPVRA